MYAKVLHCQLFMMSSLLLGGPLLATNRYIDPTGSDVSNDCSVLVTPCATLQNAVNQSSAGDTIIAAAGTYTVAGLVTVNKTLTIQGAQAGVDARTRSGAESILDNSQGISVSANNVVFNGFTIEGSTNTTFTGYGIWLNPGVSGSQIINNIFQNNVAGLGLSNAGTAQCKTSGPQAPGCCVIQYNLFQTNNVGSVAASGTGIYTDQTVGGVVSDVLITDNAFINNKNAGIGFSSTTPLTPDTDITIINNTFTNNTANTNGGAAYFYSVDTVLFENNTITNSANSAAIILGVYGGVNNLSILSNTFSGGNEAQYGIYVVQNTSHEGSGPGTTNNNITIDSNTFSDYTNTAIGFFTMAPASPTPATPDTNITITNNTINLCTFGATFFSVDTVSFEHNDVTNTAQIALQFGGGANNVTVLYNNLEFAEFGIGVGIFILEEDINSTPNTNLAIHLNNIFGYGADGAGMYVFNDPIGPVGYATCNWWGAVSGPTSTVNPTGTGDNVIGTPVTGVVVFQNFNPWLLGLAPDSPCGAAPTLTKSFSPSTVFQNQASTLTITLANPSPVTLTMTAPLVDVLPSGMKVAHIVSNTCGGTLTAPRFGSTVTLTGGTVPANGSCHIAVTVKSCKVGTSVNTLPIGALQTDQGGNTVAAQATLRVRRLPICPRPHEELYSAMANTKCPI